MKEINFDLFDAYDIDTFCFRHCISRPTYFRLKKEGQGPRIMRIGKKDIISREAASDWRKRMEDENSTAS